MAIQVVENRVLLAIAKIDASHRDGYDFCPGFSVAGGHDFRGTILSRPPH